MKELEDSLLRGFQFFLLVALCFFAADLTAAAWERRLAVAPRPISPPSVVNAHSTQVAPPRGLAMVLSATGSGEPETPTTGPGSTGPKVVTPAAPVNMTLKGTLAGQGLNLAMIDVNGTTAMVGVGEDVGGFTLVAVGPYSATLEQNGQTRKLEMKMAHIPDKATGGAPPVALPTKAEVLETEPIVANEEENVDVDMSQQEFKKLLEDPKPGAIQLRRIERKDQIVGVQVKILDTTHALARLGILDNDIVTSVNDERLSGPESLAMVYRILRNSPQLRFQIERNGQRRALNVNFAE